MLFYDSWLTDKWATWGNAHHHKCNRRTDQKMCCQTAKVNQGPSSTILVTGFFLQSTWEWSSVTILLWFLLARIIKDSLQGYDNFLLYCMYWFYMWQSKLQIPTHSNISLECFLDHVSLNACDKKAWHLFAGQYNHKAKHESTMSVTSSSEHQQLLYQFQTIYKLQKCEVLYISYCKYQNQFALLYLQHNISVWTF